MKNFWKGIRITVTGGAGFLGKHVVNKLISKGVSKKNILVPRKSTDNLINFENCLKVVEGRDVVIHLAGNVGGIGYNQAKPGTLFYDNLMMGTNLIEACKREKVTKVVLIGTICAYPRNTPVPFKEEDLWSGYPEETNAPYGLAKKMLLVQAQAYKQEFGLNSIYLLPVNLYGPGDNFDPESSHVIPALIKKFIDAQQNGDESVTVWGTGKATREFLYVEDAARAIVLATENLNTLEPVNLGSSFEIRIKGLVHLIKKIVGYKGRVVWDTTKPDGQPRRKLDTIKAKKLFNFSSSTKFEIGLKKTILWYQTQCKSRKEKNR